MGEAMTPELYFAMTGRPMPVRPEPAITSVPFSNAIGEQIVRNWRGLAEQSLPNYFYDYDFPPHTFCSYFTTEGWKNAEIQIPGFDNPANTVTYRTDENQQATSIVNGEIRYVLNPNYRNLSAEDIQRGYLEAYNKNPNSHMLGSIGYIKEVDKFYPRNGNEALLIDRNSFGHSFGLVSSAEKAPRIIEMSGPSSFIQENGTYVGNTKPNSYWDLVDDAREITERFFGNSPHQTVFDNEAEQWSTVDHLLKEVSIVPAQPLTSETLQYYGIDFDLTSDNSFSLTDHYANGSSSTKECHINPDTKDDIFHETVCLPEGTP